MNVGLERQIQVIYIYKFQFIAKIGFNTLSIFEGVFKKDISVFSSIFLFNLCFFLFFHQSI